MNINRIHRLPLRIRLFLLSLLATLAASGAVRAQDAQPGITDAQILDVVNRVAHHQLHPLKDGDYPEVTGSNALATAQAAAAPEGIAWSYPWGVALYGLLRSTEVTGDTAVGKFVVDHNLICARYFEWLQKVRTAGGDSGEMTAFLRKAKVGGLLRLGNLDSCGSMGNAIIAGVMSHPDRVSPQEKIVIARIADWVLHKQERLPDGTLWRPKVMDGTLWPDDLYMGGVFLDRYGLYTGDQEQVADAARQIIHQAAVEQDTDGLWFHGYFESTKEHAPYKWGRGNGWVTVTLVETLAALPAKDPQRAPLIEILRKQVDGLKKLQAPDGMWRQVLDKPDLWEETSCTAMFAYGIAMAVNHGWLEPSYMDLARHAFAGISKNVTADGVVNETCIGTNIGKDLDYYINRERPSDDMHGRGPVLLAGTELLLAAKK